VGETHKILNGCLTCLDGKDGKSDGKGVKKVRFLKWNKTSIDGTKKRRRSSGSGRGGELQRCTDMTVTKGVLEFIQQGKLVGSCNREKHKGEEGVWGE